MNKINSNFSGQTIFVGMDIHKSSWNLGIHLNDLFIKNVHQKPNPSVMANYLKQHYPGTHYKDANVIRCLPLRLSSLIENVKSKKMKSDKVTGFSLNTLW